ncbi:MAG: hypothetical protein OXU77_09010 [Gammaproteobacteria bacterium]|nr:hypothetical protein [Gammaproteobacteria bacterium]MDE0037684.1 hypothetical protein [Gammaproteobacteria bacterium]MDE0179012.1 hypothetical protein [Gammaproteobacteria bacterium]MDE0442959.1 hypothetical protein [Gammaproteobacteria bacterium]
MPERTPYQTIEERLASVETKTDRLVQEVDAARIENQAAFTELRSLIAKNDASMRADTQEMESRLRAEIKGTEDELRSEIKGTEDKLRAEIKGTEDKLSAEINRSEQRLRDHMTTTTSTLLSHVRLVVAIMVPISLGVIGLLAKVIFDSG